MADYLKTLYDEIEYKKTHASSPKERATLTLKQIDVLKQIQQQFLIQASNQGYNLESYNILDIKLQQFKLMKQLAEKSDLPTEEYDKSINEIMKKIFG